MTLLCFIGYPRPVRVRTVIAAALALALVLLLFAESSLSHKFYQGIARSIVSNKVAAVFQGTECEFPSDVGRSSDLIKDVTIKRASRDAQTFALVHMDHHPTSPYHNPGFSFGERMKFAVKRSRNRASLVRQIISPDFSSDRGVNVESTIGSSKSSIFKEPLAASPGSYFMLISLGTPSQTMTAIVDTGSDLSWVQCYPCLSCYNQSSPVYSPLESSTYKKMTYSNKLCSTLPRSSNSRGFCSYKYMYGDQSFSEGDVAMDTITLTTTNTSKVKVPDFAFGCGRNNQGTFSGSDGLVGLGQGSVSFPSQLGGLFGNKFSYCLVSMDSAETTTSPIIFGDASVTSGVDLQYTPLLRNDKNPTFYYVTLTGIKVGGQQLNIPPGSFEIQRSGSGGVILDSGTTITQLINAAYTPLLKKIRSLMKYPTKNSSAIGLDLCYDFSGIDITSSVFPQVTLQFAGFEMNLPLPNTFIAVDNHKTVCLAFTGGSKFTIIGNIQQQNFYFSFDRFNQRVGVAATDCDSFSAHQ